VVFNGGLELLINWCEINYIFKFKKFEAILLKNITSQNVSIIQFRVSSLLSRLLPNRADTTRLGSYILVVEDGDSILQNLLIKK